MLENLTGKWLWNKVDNYFADLFAPQDDQLKAVRRANREARLPEIDVSPVQGKFLYVLIQITQAKRVLEIGTLGGYSSIWMARALPKDGRIVTLEFEPRRGRHLVPVGLRAAARLPSGLGRSPDGKSSQWPASTVAGRR